MHIPCWQVGEKNAHDVAVREKNAGYLRNKLQISGGGDGNFVLLAGDEDREDGAGDVATVAAAHTQGAAVLVDDVLRDPEAEPGAGGLLGGEEGFVEVAKRGGRHAGAGVGDGETNSGAAAARVAGLADSNEKSARRVFDHGVNGVADEVGDDLAELAGEDEDAFMPAVLSLDVDLCRTDAALVEGKDGIDEIADPGGGGARGAAVEAQRFGGDVADARELELRLLEVAADLGRGVALRQIDEVDDGLERVVDLMRDGAGETADDGELLVFAKAAFGALARGDVRGGAEPLGDVVVGVE